MTNSDNVELNEKLDFQFDVIKRYDHYIGTTNFKIGLLLSFLVAVLIGLPFRIIVLAIENNSFPFLSSLASIPVAVAVLFAIWNLIRAVSPNLTSVEYRSFIFFGDVASWNNGAHGYANDFEKATRQELLRDLTFQTHSVAKVTAEKFRLIGISTRITLFAVLPLLGVNLAVAFVKC